MLQYHAAYYPIEDGWYMAKVLDFPGAVSQGRTLRSARGMIRDALRQVAEDLPHEEQTTTRRRDFLTKEQREKSSPSPTRATDHEEAPKDSSLPSAP